MFVFQDKDGKWRESGTGRLLDPQPERHARPRSIVPQPSEPITIQAMTLSPADMDFVKTRDEIQKHLDDDIKPLLDYNYPSWPRDKQGRLLVGRKMPNVVIGFGEGDATPTHDGTAASVITIHAKKLTGLNYWPPEYFGDPGPDEPTMPKPLGVIPPLGIDIKDLPSMIEGPTFHFVRDEAAPPGDLAARVRVVRMLEGMEKKLGGFRSTPIICSWAKPDEPTIIGGE